jgi:hypothetical protein
MKLDFSATGPSGHVQADFENDTIEMEFSKTTPSERGLIDTMIEKAKSEGMSVHTVSKDGELKPLTDEKILGKIFESKGKIALVGTKEAVIKLAKIHIDKEIQGGRLVMEGAEDGSWKVLKIGEFEAKDKPQKVKSTAPVGGG